MAEKVQNKINYCKENFGTTLIFIAKKSGICKETLCRFVNNKQQLSTATLEKLNDILNCIISK